MYEKLKQAIQDGMYTVTEAVNLLNAFLQTGQITACLLYTSPSPRD